MIRTVVVDDQELVREGLVAILDRDPKISVVASAGDGVDGLALMQSTQPDVAVVDVRMPRMDGIELTERVTTDLTTRVLILTSFDLEAYVFAALRAGASGFLLKDARPDVFRQAVHTVAAGDALLGPKATGQLVRRFAGRSPQGVSPLEALTAREYEVLILMAEGLSNQEIGAELFVAPSTVKTHVHRVLAKLGLRDRVHAVLYAYEQGLRDMAVRRQRNED